MTVPRISRGAIDLLLLASHSSMRLRSYVNPSIANTGSSMIKQSNTLSKKSSGGSCGCAAADAAAAAADAAATAATCDCPSATANSSSEKCGADADAGAAGAAASPSPGPTAALPLHAWKGGGPPNSNGFKRVECAVSCVRVRHAAGRSQWLVNNMRECGLSGLRITRLCQKACPVCLSVSCSHARVS